jgi:hypothetical protein
LNGYQQPSSQPGIIAASQTQSSPSMGLPSSSSPASTGSLFSSPALGPSSSSHYQYDANTGIASPSSGSAGIGTGISALGLMGQLTKNPQLSQMAGLAGAAMGASNGNYTGLGGVLGNLSGITGGSLIGAALGSYMSPDANTARFMANAGVSMIPGLGQLYGLGNMFTNGALSNSLFGKDASFGDTGQFSPATPGALANLGSVNATRVYGTGDNAVTVSNSGNGHSSDGSSTAGNMSSGDRSSIAAANGYGGGV